MQLELLVNQFYDLKVLRRLNYLFFGESSYRFELLLPSICGVLTILSLTSKMDPCERIKIFR